MNTYHVSKNKVPCKLMNIGLHYKGVLVPINVSEYYTNFGEGVSGKRKAVRALNRTIRIAKRLRSSVISDWDKIGDIVSPGQFALEARIIKPTPRQIMKAHQYLYYVKNDTVLTDFEYDGFCKEHNLDGKGGSDLASSYKPEIVALAEDMLITSKIKSTVAL